MRSRLEPDVSVWTRIKLAFQAFFTILFKGRLPAALGAPPAPTSEPPPVESAAPVASGPDEHDRAVQMLALLQRDGRLIDFLMEDLGAYQDAQIGAAVRDVHAGCRRVLDRYVGLAAILVGRERERVTVAAGFDPAAVRLVGRITGQPPFQGVLLHRGWRVDRVELPALAAGAGRAVVAPAEVEVG
jgi:hypothetical protein